MKAGRPRRHLSVRNLVRVISAALIVVGCIASIDPAAAAEPVGDVLQDGSVEPTVAPPAPRFLPPTTDVGAVTPAEYLETTEPPLDLLSAPSLNLQIPGLPEELPPSHIAVDETNPIDLPSALRLAGANNLQIALARERVNAAAARAAAANALWIPSISSGVVYNNHAGRIQGTEGEILEVSRNSLFVGGAAVFGTSAANGGASGPARMFVDLSLADTIFEPLAAREFVRATAADRTATFNDTLLQVAATYLALVQAQVRVNITEEAVANAAELARITGEFAKSGHGLQADADRAHVEAASRRRDVLQAEEDLAVVSAELARLLRIDPAVRLQAVDTSPMPLEFVDQAVPLKSLVNQAIAARPEITSADAERDAACYRVRQEQVRPWLPHLFAGASGGGFGGGEGSDVTNFSDRTDFDVAAIWQFENLGFGNAARQREQQSLHRQASLSVQQVRDLIAAEVTKAYQRLQLRQRQIDVTRLPVESAQQALRLNLEGIRGGVLRPIEIQQAIGALAASRTQYLVAVIDYNLAQLQMLRAIGQPPDVDMNGKSR